MILIGDIASASEETTAFLRHSISGGDSLFRGKRVICNFEGLIGDNINYVGNEPVLFNHYSVLDVLDTGQKPVLCLSNNHIQDLPAQFGSTISLLDQRKIPFCGAGLSASEAEKPLIFNEGSYKIALFNACWDFLLYNHRNPRLGVYVSVINELKMVERVASQKKSEPDTKIVVYLHWNLDLETLPFPMHRQFARALIDAGAGLVVGSHSHCVQGGEQYRDGYIIYGLGNFFMPHNLFINGRLAYPEMASTELALEWNPVSGEAICHWLRYELTDKSHNLIHTGSERFEASSKLLAFTPYTGMTDEEYMRFYKKNRRKKILIPVYKDYREQSLNRVYTNLLKNRARFARMLARLRIIKWQN